MSLRKIAPIALAGALSIACDNPIPNSTPREKEARAFVMKKADKRDSYVCYEQPEHRYVGMDLGKVVDGSRGKIETVVDCKPKIEREDNCPVQILFDEKGNIIDISC